MPPGLAHRFANLHASWGLQVGKTVGTFYVAAHCSVVKVISGCVVRVRVT